MNTLSPKFGPYLKSLRMLKRISLRQFSLSANADPGNVSRIERGILSPPHDRKILERYAAALNLEEASDEWFTFFDYAATDRGVIPRDLMSKEEVVNFLPAFFRTMRSRKPTDDEMIRIIEKVRNS